MARFHVGFLPSIPVVAVAILLAVIVPGAPAKAGVGCWGDWCSGRDPLSTGCSADASTVATAGIYGTDGATQIELRWSPTCQANWARVQSWAGGTLTAVQDTGYTQGEIGSNGSFRWTAMIYSPHRCVQAVLRGAWGPSPTWCV